MLNKYSHNSIELLRDRDLPPGIKGLALAVLMEDSHSDKDCMRCQEQLPAYIDAIMMGEDKRDEWIWTRTHLLICEPCGIEFGELFDMLIMQLEDEFPPSKSGISDSGFLRHRE